MRNCFDDYYRDSGRWPGTPHEENNMAHLEYSDGRRSDRVWATAPKWACDRERIRRRNNNEPELRYHGLTDEQCSERQLAFNREAEQIDRIRLARAEALLESVRDELSRAKRT